MKKQIFTKGKIKIGILFFAILLMVAGFSYLQNIYSIQAQGSGTFAGGSGTVGDPYQISNWTQLDEVRNYLDKNFILTANLSAYTTGYVDIGDDFIPIGSKAYPAGNADFLAAKAFKGSFDGNGFWIMDLKINRPANNEVGMFSKLEGKIFDLGLINVNIIGADFVGGIVGRMNSGSIENSYVTGIIKAGTIASITNGGGPYIIQPKVFFGGISGIVEGGEIKNAFTFVSLNSSYAPDSGHEDKVSYGGITGFLADPAKITASNVSKGYLQSNSGIRYIPPDYPDFPIFYQPLVGKAITEIPEGLDWTDIPLPGAISRVETYSGYKSPILPKGSNVSGGMFPDWSTVDSGDTHGGVEWSWVSWQANKSQSGDSACALISKGCAFAYSPGSAVAGRAGTERIDCGSSLGGGGIAFCSSDLSKSPLLRDFDKSSYIKFKDADMTGVTWAGNGSGEFDGSSNNYHNAWFACKAYPDGIVDENRDSYPYFVWEENGWLLNDELMYGIELANSEGFTADPRDYKVATGTALCGKSVKLEHIENYGYYLGVGGAVPIRTTRIKEEDPPPCPPGQHRDQNGDCVDDKEPEPPKTLSLLLPPSPPSPTIKLDSYVNWVPKFLVKLETNKASVCSDTGTGEEVSTSSKFKLTWKVNDATDCTASMTEGEDPNWTGDLTIDNPILPTSPGRLSGSSTKELGPLNAGTYKYKITCNGNITNGVAASLSDEVTINVIDGSQQNISISSDPSDITTIGSTSTIRWSLQDPSGDCVDRIDVFSCTGSVSGPSGFVDNNFNGKQISDFPNNPPYVTPILNKNGNYYYSLNCKTESGVDVVDGTMINVSIPPPTVTISVVPEVLRNEGATSRISWIVQNATQCTASTRGSFGGDDTWSGSVNATDGSHSTSTMRFFNNGTYHYDISCTGPGGTATSTDKIFVRIPPEITGFISDPEIITNDGQEVELNVSYKNADFCEIIGYDVNGGEIFYTATELDLIISGDEQIWETVFSVPESMINGDYNFIATCHGHGEQNDNSSASLDIKVRVPPSFDFYANPSTGNMSSRPVIHLENLKNTKGCDYEYNGFDNNQILIKNTDFDMEIQCGNSAEDYLQRITCFAKHDANGNKVDPGAFGSMLDVTKSITTSCTMTDPGYLTRSEPTLTFEANPASVNSGNSTTLVWDSTNTSNCSASGAWSGTKSTSGSEIVGPITSNRTYVLTCTGDGSSKSSSVNVSVLSAVEVKTSSAKVISSFKIGESVGVINNLYRIIKINVAPTEDIKSLIPTIVIPKGATIIPASGVPQDFTDSVVYTVTAQDKTKTTYEVRVTQ